MARFAIKRKQTLTVLGTVLLFVCFKYISIRHGPYMPKYPVMKVNVSGTNLLLRYDVSHWKPAETKRILLWTTLFKSWNDNWLDKAEQELGSCPAKCTVSAEKSKVHESDALLFHANDVWVSQRQIDVPKERIPGQVWVLLSMEPVPNMFNPLNPIIFNWTMHYRREATIHLPYGRVRLKTQNELRQLDGQSNERSIFQEKRKFAATLVSNCYDHIGRYQMITELTTYIDLEVFGKCSGRKLCPPASDMSAFDCGEKYLREYKFYIAFENSFCRDYLSEKVWYALYRDQIPVIAVDRYTAGLLPPNSFLNVFDFPSLKALTEKMSEIGNDENLFNSYFNWQRKYTMEQFLPYFCMLCTELHKNKTAQFYPDMDLWLDNDTCSRI